MVESTDLYSGAPTFNDTDTGYILPNDPTEHSRLHDQHLSLVPLTNNRVIAAPVSDPNTFLDISYGTGIVTSCFETRNSPMPPTSTASTSAQFQQPKPGEKQAPNITFVCGGSHKLSGIDPRLRYESAHFAYRRMLRFGMTDWPGYVSEVSENAQARRWLELGEYIEIVFLSDDRPNDPREDWEWPRAIRAGGKRQGLDLGKRRNHTVYLEKASFVDARRWEYKLPFWKGAEKERPGRRRTTEHVFGDQWGSYQHVIPRLLEGSAYEEEGVERLRRKMKNDLRVEEGTFQVFLRYPREET